MKPQKTQPNKAPPMTPEEMMDLAGRAPARVRRMRLQPDPPAAPPAGAEKPSQVRFDGPVIRPPSETSSPRKGWRRTELGAVVAMGAGAIALIGGAVVAVVLRRRRDPAAQPAKTR